jgi:hypothetical protein
VLCNILCLWKLKETFGYKNKDVCKYAYNKIFPNKKEKPQLFVWKINLETGQGLFLCNVYNNVDA